MAKMVKDTQKLICPRCSKEILYARVVKTWVDPSKKGDRMFKGMIHRCQCGVFDKEGRDVKALVG